MRKKYRGLPPFVAANEGTSDMPPASVREGPEPAADAPPDWFPFLGKEPTAGNDSDAEFIALAHTQVLDAFDAACIDDLLAELHKRLGDDIPEAKSNAVPIEHRGGPYLLGSTNRRAWRIYWTEAHDEWFESVYHADRARLGNRPTQIIVQWTENLPFAIVVVRSPFSPMPNWLHFVAEGFLATLPGRLGPSNYTSRSTVETIVAAKITEARMTRMRAMLETPTDDQATRQEIQGTLAPLRPIKGRLWLWSRWPNVLEIEGVGTQFLGETEGIDHGFRAFVWSDGNLGPHRGHEWHIPLAIPTSKGLSDWAGFNHMPFMIASIRHASHVGVQAGPIDEEAGRRRAATNYTAQPLSWWDGAWQLLWFPRWGMRRAQRRTISEDYAEVAHLHGRLIELEYRLHMARNRSRPQESGEPWVGQEMERFLMAEDNIWGAESDQPPSRAALARKEATEAATQAALDSVGIRLGRMVDYLTVRENQATSRATLYFTRTAVLVAVVTLVVVVILQLVVAMQ